MESTLPEEEDVIEVVDNLLMVKMQHNLLYKQNTKEIRDMDHETRQTMIKNIDEARIINLDDPQTCRIITSNYEPAMVSSLKTLQTELTQLWKTIVQQDKDAAPARMKASAELKRAEKNLASAQQSVERQRRP